MSGGAEVLGELSISSYRESIAVKWRYLDAHTRQSDEREVLAIIHHHMEVLARAPEGAAAVLTLRVHRVPGERGTVGPPGFSWTIRGAQGEVEVDRPVAELLSEATRRLWPDRHQGT